MNVSFRFKTLLINLSIILLYFLWPYFSSYLLSLFSFDSNTNLMLTFVLNLVCLFLIIVVYIKDLMKDFKKFNKNPKSYMKRGFKYFLYGLIGYGFVNILISFVFESSNISNDNLVILENVFTNNKFLLFLSTVLYYPVVEEIVFKKTFKDIIDNKWLFVIITALANAFFAYAFSLSNPLSLIYIIPSTIFYMGLSYSYYKSDNIMVPIIYRVIYNIIPNIALVLESLLIISLK